MNKYYRNKKSKTKKVLLICGFCLILMTGALGSYKLLLKKDSSNSSSEQQPIDKKSIDFGSPSKEEKTATDANKENVAKQMEQDQLNTEGKKSVVPVITSPVPSPATNPKDLRISAYISGIFEDNGTCTATIKGSTTIIKSSKGFKNVSTTDCEPINISLAPGPWTINMSYDSINAKGQSSTITFGVN